MFPQYGLGSHATYISHPWAYVYPVPSGVTTRIAAAALSQGMTAVSVMTEAYAVQPGDTVLVHAVAGGLGLMLAQYALSRRATVIGTTSTQAKAEEAKACGVQWVILYKKEDTVQRVMEITEGRGVDASFDGVGKDTSVCILIRSTPQPADLCFPRFEQNFKVIKRKGTFVSLGNASGMIPPFLPIKLSEKNIKFLRPTCAFPFPFIYPLISPTHFCAV